MHLKELEAAARSWGCEVQPEALLSNVTSFKIGGSADLLITVPHAEALSAVLQFCECYEIPWLFLGNGTNVVAADEGFRGAVLRLSGEQESPSASGENRISCPAGVPLKQLCRFAREQGLSGLEFAFGIPGSVGGAVYMNAGAYGGDMSQVLESVTCLNKSGEIVCLSADELDLRYRHSALMEKHLIAVEATFLLQPDEIQAIGARMEEYMARRREKQPLEYPSAGSFFKRPVGYFAGALIEKSGLKGFTVGGAQISEKHAGFVINRGGATCDDLHRLTREVQRIILRDHGVKLETEVLFLPSELQEDSLLADE